jgi:ABC-2 type transport system permease protein
VIAIFLIINGLFLFVFTGEYNILDNGIANLSAFYLLTPWVFMFLIPAVTMKSFSEEMKQGTLELLLTKPINPIKIVIGKFLGAFVLVIFALLPTLLYVLTIHQLSKPVGNIDIGSIIGSYLGLLFLVMSFTSIGIFTSSLSNNQIVAFISAVFISLSLYYGFEGLAGLNWFSGTFNIEQLGMAAHFKSMSRGVLDTRDLIYFLSITVSFVIFTEINITKQ